MAARRPISLQISVVFPVFHRVAAQLLGSAYIDMFIGNVHIRIRADDIQRFGDVDFDGVAGAVL